MSRRSPRPPAQPSHRRLLPLAAAAGLVLLLVTTASLATGARDLSAHQVAQALIAPTGSEADTLVWRSRVPRTVLGIAVGAALALAGALMQAVTRNPLADPGLLGVNAGAATAVVTGLVLGAPSTGPVQVTLALAGAAVAATAVVALGGRGADAGSARLVLAGAAVSASLSGAVAGATLLDQTAFERFRFWAVGTLADQPLDALLPALPALLAGLAAGVVLTRRLDVLGLGDASSAALGVQPARTRALGLAAVVLLCGASTAVVGPIAFLGLAVPHAARLLCGPRTGGVTTLSLLLGPALLLGADVVGRLVARPGEVEVAIVMGLLGAPVFVALVRSRAVPAL